MKQIKTQRICVRLTAAERASIVEQARALNVSESRLIRDALKSFFQPVPKSSARAIDWSVSPRWN